MKSPFEFTYTNLIYKVAQGATEEDAEICAPQAAQSDLPSNDGIRSNQFGINHEISKSKGCATMRRSPRGLPAAFSKIVPFWEPRLSKISTPLWVLLIPNSFNSYSIDARSVALCGLQGAGFRLFLGRALVYFVIGIGIRYAYF